MEKEQQVKDKFTVEFCNKANYTEISYFIAIKSSLKIKKKNLNLTFLFLFLIFISVYELFHCLCF